MLTNLWLPFLFPFRFPRRSGGRGAGQILLGRLFRGRCIVLLTGPLKRGRILQRALFRLFLPAFPFGGFFGFFRARQLLPFLLWLRHCVRAVNHPPVFQKTQGVHKESGDAFPADPDEGYHSSRQCGHAQDDDAGGQGKRQVDHRHPDQQGENNGFNGIADVKGAV